MATCKECICYESCLDFAEMIGKNIVESITNGHYRCEFIKDRSRFVELPCKLGDEIFYTTMGRIYQGIVGRIELDDEGLAIITTDGYCPDSSICYHTQKEREENA